MIKIDSQNLHRGFRLWRSLNFDPNYELGPLLLEVGITNICNYRCVFCGEHSFLLKENHEGRVLKEETLNRLVMDLKRLKIPEIRLSGNGEQLLLSQTVDFINKTMNRHKIAIVTNGSTLRKIDYDIFRHLNKITISLNSIEADVHKKIHGYENRKTFDIVIKNIERLLSYSGARNKLQINYVIMKDNLREIDELLSLSRAWGIPFLIRPISAVFKDHDKNLLTETDIEHLLSKIEMRFERSLKLTKSETNTLQYLQKALVNCQHYTNNEKPKNLMPCYAGFYGGFIDAMGGYRICPYCSDILGNINDHDFNEIWKSQKAIKARFKATVMDLSGDPVCAKCYHCPEVFLYSAQFHRAYVKLPLQRNHLVKAIENRSLA